MDFSDALNSPLAVVVILAIVFGFIMMGLDKLTYFVRSLKKRTANDRIAESYDKLEPVLDKLSTNLEGLNKTIAHQMAIQEKNHQSVKESLNRIEGKV